MMAAPNPFSGCHSNGCLPDSGRAFDSAFTEAPTVPDVRSFDLTAQAWTSNFDLAFSVRSEQQEDGLSSTNRQPTNQQPREYAGSSSHHPNAGEIGGHIASHTRLHPPSSEQEMFARELYKVWMNTPAQHYPFGTSAALATWPTTGPQHSHTISYPMSDPNQPLHSLSVPSHVSGLLNDLSNAPATSGFVAPVPRSDRSIGVSRRVAMAKQTSKAINPRPLAPKRPPPSEGSSTSAAQSPSVYSSRHGRKKFDDKGRRKVKNIRDMGACIRCRRYKLSCDLQKPCGSCQKVSTSMKIYRGPCVNPRLETVHSFRSGDGDNGYGFKEPKMPDFHWVEGSPVHRIEVHWPFTTGDGTTRMTVPIEVKEFVPGDVPPDEEWVAGGVSRKVRLKPWACQDAHMTKRRLLEFVKNCQSPLENEISSMHQSKHPIMGLMWQEIIRYRYQTRSPDTISNAMRLYTCAVMNTRYLGSNAASIFRVDPGTINSPPAYFDANGPLPNQLTCQLQMMIASMQLENQARVIKSLKKMVLGKDRKHHWYEVLLTIFVLLATIELVYQNQARFLATKDTSNVNDVTNTMNEQWEDSFENLKSHWRYIMDGHRPFEQSDDELMRELQMMDRTGHRCGLQVDQVNFVFCLKREVLRSRSDLELARGARNAAPSGSRLLRPLSAICELFLADETER